MKKEYFDIYFFNGDEWLFTCRFPLVNDRVHYSIARELEKIQQCGFKFRIDYVEIEE